MFGAVQKVQHRSLQSGTLNNFLSNLVLCLAAREGMVINMKINKFIAATAVAIMFFGFSAYANEINIEANQIPYTDNIYVKISNANPNTPVSVRITDSNGEKDFYEMGYTDENGGFEFSYVNDRHCGNMNIDVNAGGKRANSSYFKMSESMYDEFVNAVKSQQALQGSGNPDGSVIKSVFDKYNDKFSLDKTAFDTFSEQRQSDVYDIIANDTSYVGKITQMKDVVDAYYMAVLTESFKDNPNNFLTLLQVLPYKEILEREGMTPTLIKGVDAASNSVMKKALSAVRLSGSDSKKLLKDLEFEVFKTAVADALSWNDVKTMSEVYENLLGVDTRKADMSDYKELIGFNCSSYSEYANEFNNRISKADNKKPSTSSGGGGGGYVAVASKNPTVDNNIQIKNENSEEKLVFDDLNDALWAIKAVTYVHDKGIISGVGDGKFEPNRYITRAEAAKITVLMTGDSQTGTIPFDDVSENDWYYPYVCNLYNRGVINGISKTEFAPNLLVTRQQMAVMVYNAIRKDADEVAETNIADRDEIASWAIEAVNYLFSKKIVSGRIGGIFAPNDYITRAEAATIVYNLIK